MRREQLLEDKDTLWQIMEVSKLRQSSDVVGRPVSESVPILAKNNVQIGSRDFSIHVKLERYPFGDSPND